MLSGMGISPRELPQHLVQDGLLKESDRLKLNLLLRASHTFLTGTPALSRVYSERFRRHARHLLQDEELPPWVLDGLCLQCGAALVPGLTCKVRVRHLTSRARKRRRSPNSAPTKNQVVQQCSVCKVSNPIPGARATGARGGAAQEGQLASRTPASASAATAAATGADGKGKKRKRSVPGDQSFIALGPSKSTDRPTPRCGISSAFSFKPKSDAASSGWSAGGWSSSARGVVGGREGGEGGGGGFSSSLLERLEATHKTKKKRKKPAAAASALEGGSGSGSGSGSGNKNKEPRESLLHKIRIG